MAVTLKQTPWAENDRVAASEYGKNKKKMDINPFTDMLKKEDKKKNFKTDRKRSNCIHSHARLAVEPETEGGVYTNVRVVMAERMRQPK